MKRLILILMLLCSPLYMSIKMNKDILFGFLNVLCLLGWCLSWAWFCRRSKVLSFVWTFLLALTILALLCSPQLWAACAASTSGAWTTGGNWTGCAGSGGVPASTDAVSVPTGKAMTCNGACVAKTLTTAGTGSVTVQSGGTLTVNNSTSGGSVVLAGTGTLEIQSGGTATLGGQVATSNEIEVTVGGGTTFLLDNGGTFNMYGSVKISNTGIGEFNGHTICTPPDTSHYYNIYSSLAAGVDTTLISFVGTNYTTSPAVFEGPSGQTAGDSCHVSNNGNNNPKFVAQNAIFNNIGDSGSDAITMPSVSTAESILINNVLMLHSGKLNLATNSGVSNATTFSINGLDIRNANAASGVVALVASLNTTTFTGTRIIQNVTCDKESATSMLSMQIAGHGFQVGLSSRAGDGSDAMGILSYNCLTALDNANSIATTVRESYFSVDSSTAGQTIYETDYNQGTSTTDSLFYVHNSNAHDIVMEASNRSSTTNHYDYNFIDGDGYVSSDSGEWLSFPAGPAVETYNILVNGNQNLMSGLTGAASLTAEHDLLYNQASAYAGDLANLATGMPSFQYHLISYPWVQSSGTCSSIYEAGFSTSASTFVTFTSTIMDHIGYYGITNSGDPGASSCTRTTGTGGGLGVILGGAYIEFPGMIRGTQSNKTATSGTTGTTLVCSGCSFSQAGELAVIAGDEIWNATANTYTYVASVTNGTTLVMTTSGGVASGNTFDIRKSLESPGYVYGANSAFGADDIHASITYLNPAAAICDWYNTIGGGLTCTHTGTATDTNIASVSHDFVALNGYDYGSGSSLSGTNCASACPQVVTPRAGMSVASAMAWLRTQYTQYDGVYKNLDQRGSPYADAGATLTYPAAVIQ